MPKSNDTKTPSSETETAEQAAAAPKAVKPYELSRATRDGKLVRVMTDDVRVWKDVGDAKDAK